MVALNEVWSFYLSLLLKNNNNDTLELNKYTIVANQIISLLGNNEILTCNQNIKSKLIKCLMIIYDNAGNYFYFIFERITIMINNHL